jgi:hypothetical protein
MQGTRAGRWLGAADDLLQESAAARQVGQAVAGVFSKGIGRLGSAVRALRGGAPGGGSFGPRQVNQGVAEFLDDELLTKGTSGSPGRGFVAGDRGELRQTVKAARAGNPAAQGELEVIKGLRARGMNVYKVDPSVRPGVTHDIFFGGPRGVAEGMRGDIKTLMGPDLVENTVVQHLFKGAKQVGSDGTVFVNYGRTTAPRSSVEAIRSNFSEGRYFNEKMQPSPSDVNIELYPFE